MLSLSLTNNVVRWVFDHSIINCLLFVMSGLTLAPLVVKVDPNFNVILTACLTVFVGCCRSVKPTPPSVSSVDYAQSLLYLNAFMVHDLISLNMLCMSWQETMSNEHAMRFPFVGSAMLLSLFLLFKFLSKDLVNTVLTAYFFVLGIVALSYVLFLLSNVLVMSSTESF